MAQRLKDLRRRFSSNHGVDSKDPSESKAGAHEPAQPQNEVNESGPTYPRKPGSLEKIPDKSFVKVGGPGFNTLLPSPESCGISKSAPSKVVPDPASREIYKVKSDEQGESKASRLPRKDPNRFLSNSSAASQSSVNPKLAVMNLANTSMNLGRKVMNSLSRKLTRPAGHALQTAAAEQHTEESSTLPAVIQKTSVERAPVDLPSKPVVVPKASRERTSVDLPSKPVVADCRKSIKKDKESCESPPTAQAQPRVSDATFSKVVLHNARQKALKELEALNMDNDHQHVVDIMVEAALRASWDSYMEMQADFFREVTALRDRIRKIEADSEKLIESVPKGMDIFQGLKGGDSKIEYYEPMKYLSKPVQELVMEITNEKIKMLFAKDRHCRKRMNEQNLEQFDKQLQEQRSSKYERVVEENKQLKEQVANLTRANERMVRDCDHYLGQISNATCTGVDAKDRLRRMTQQIEYEQTNTKQIAKELLETCNKEKAALEKVEKLEEKLAKYEEKYGLAYGKKKHGANQAEESRNGRRRNSTT